MARLVRAVIWPSAAASCAAREASINLQLDRPSTLLIDHQSSLCIGSRYGAENANIYEYASKRARKTNLSLRRDRVQEF
jgi:hypothetical protein